LFVSSTFQTKTNPIVHRVHRMVSNRETGWAGDFFKTVVCSFSDFTGKHITLNPRIYDIDSSKHLKENIKDVTQLIGESGVFPAIPVANLLSTVSNVLLGFIEKIDQHDKIID